MKRFVRRSTLKYSRMGLRRRKLQKWRAAKGRHSKIRENRFGYTKSPRIGFKSAKKESGKINWKIPFLVRNMNDFSKLNKENILIISGTVGARKKIDIIKKAGEMKIEILNVRTGEKNGPK